MEFVSFEVLASAINNDLKKRYQERFPKSCSAALSRTAVQCRDLMKQHIQSAFNRPTPYAVNAPRAVTANITTLSAAVLLRDFGGTPAEKYLGPEILGGRRGQKRSERALQAAGFLSSGYAMPGSGAAMDAFGNQQPSEIRKILSVLRAFGEQGYKANRTKAWNKATRIGQIFAVRSGSSRKGLKPGVYRRTARGVVCLMRFVNKAPEYRVRLPFDALVKADAERIFPIELERAISDLGR